MSEAKISLDRCGQFDKYKSFKFVQFFNRMSPKFGKIYTKITSLISDCDINDCVCEGQNSNKEQ